jgi:integrase
MPLTVPHAGPTSTRTRGRCLAPATQAQDVLGRPVELRRALTHAPVRVRPMLYLAAFAGLRAVEVANLRREDVRDDDAPPCMVLYGKGDKERTVPLSAPVLAELRRHGMPNRGRIFRMYGEDRHPTARPITAHRVSATCNAAYLAEVGAGAFTPSAAPPVCHAGATGVRR